MFFFNWVHKIITYAYMTNLMASDNYHEQTCPEMSPGIVSLSRQ